MDREQEFRATLERYRNRVFTLAFYQLGGNEEAEDATQEVFLRLWRNWSEVAQRESPGPWLIRVTRNHCIDLLRKRKSRREAIVDGVREETVEAAPSPLAGPRCALEEERTRERLEAAIQELDEPYRSVVVLREIEECSYAEIAEGLQMSLEQVKVNLHRARKKLREKCLERETVNDA